MAEDITIPKIGKVKKQYVYIVGAGVAGYVGYRWWISGSTTEEETLAPEESIGTIGADIGSGTGGYYGTGSASSDTTVGDDVFDTSAKWSREVVSYMADTLGYDAALVGLATGKYIRGDKLTKQEADIVRTAVGVFGQPPGGPYTIIEGSENPSPSTMGQPTGLAVKSKDADSVTLTWNPVAGAAGYRIYRSGASQNVGQSIDTTAEIGGLQPAETYTFTVRAMDSSGKTGAASSGLKVVTSDLKLSAPSGLKVESTTKTTATLVFNKVAGAAGYRLYMSGVANNVGSSVDTRGIISNLKPGKKYTFHVRAVSPSWALGPKSANATGTTKR